MPIQPSSARPVNVEPSTQAVNDDAAKFSSASAVKYFVPGPAGTVVKLAEEMKGGQVWALVFNPAYGRFWEPDARLSRCLIPKQVRNAHAHEVLMQKCCS